jgi:hypothetical protein
MEDNFNYEETNIQKRPTFLKVLCILTFINIGFGILGLLIGVMSGKASATELEQSAAAITQIANDVRSHGSVGLANMLEQVNDMAFYANENHWMAMGLTALAITAGFLGAVWMYNGKKSGFHSYIIYNVIALFGVYVYIPSESIPVFSIVVNGIFSLIFIFMYSRNLHWMK